MKTPMDWVSHRVCIADSVLFNVKGEPLPKRQFHAHTHLSTGVLTFPGQKLREFFRGFRMDPGRKDASLRHSVDTERRICFLWGNTTMSEDDISILESHRPFPFCLCRWKRETIRLCIGLPDPNEGEARDSVRTTRINRKSDAFRHLF